MPRQVRWMVPSTKDAVVEDKRFPFTSTGLPKVLDCKAELRALAREDLPPTAEFAKAKRAARKAKRLEKGVTKAATLAARPAKKARLEQEEARGDSAKKGSKGEGGMAARMRTRTAARLAEGGGYVGDGAPDGHWGIGLCVFCVFAPARVLLPPVDQLC